MPDDGPSSKQYDVILIGSGMGALTVASLGVAGAMMGGLTTLGYLPDGVSMPAAYRAAARR